MLLPTTRSLAGDLKDVFEDIRIRERNWSKQPSVVVVVLFVFNFGCGVRVSCLALFL